MVFTGRFVGAALLALMALFAVLSGCAGSDDPLASRTAAGRSSRPDEPTTGDAAGRSAAIEVPATTAAAQAQLRTTDPTRATTGSTATATQPTATRPTVHRSTTARPTTTARPASTVTTSQAPTGVLVFTRTAGFRHPSITDGVSTMTELARSAGYRVTASEDPSLFNDRDLAGFAAVIFLSTSGDVLNVAQQAAFERYIEGGGGFVGVHAATDTEYGWPWYGRLVGTWFADHPLLPNDEFVDCHCSTASVVRQASHPSTGHLPAVWSHRDEWYNFRSPLPATARILLTVDESSYTGGTMGSVHPVSWTQSIGQGRSWYTALGHTPASYRDPQFRGHLLGGLEWAAGG